MRLGRRAGALAALLLAGNLPASAANIGDTDVYVRLLNSWALSQIQSVPLTSGSGTGNTLKAPASFFVCTTTCTITPPVPSAGFQFCVMNDDNVSTVITLGAIGSSARYENTARTAYGTAGTGTLVSAGAVGDAVCILGLNATHYLTMPGYVGTWTAN